MKKLIFPSLLLAAMFTFSNCESLKKAAAEALVKATVEEIGKALKQALEQGITKGVDKLGIKDGYLKSAYKIGLPPEATKVTSKLKSIPGFEKLEENLIEKINRGAEDAAKESAPIFVSAIKGMTFDDARKILMGADNSATEYLRGKTFQDLYGKFNPKITASLDKFGARDLWKKAADAYNKIPLVTKVNANLDDYITRQALDGLFKQVESEEKNIRTNKAARPTIEMKKAFAEQDASRK